MSRGLVLQVGQGENKRQTRSWKFGILLVPFVAGHDHRSYSTYALQHSQTALPPHFLGLFPGLLSHFVRQDFLLDHPAVSGTARVLGPMSVKT